MQKSARYAGEVVICRLKELPEDSQLRKNKEQTGKILEIIEVISDNIYRVQGNHEEVFTLSEQESAALMNIDDYWNGVTDSMICPECTTANIIDANYCAECGSMLRN